MACWSNLKAISLRNMDEKLPSVIFLTEENNCFLTSWKSHKLFTPHIITAISNFQVWLRPQVTHIFFEVHHFRQLFLGQGLYWISFCSSADWQHHYTIDIETGSSKLLQPILFDILFLSLTFKHCRILRANHKWLWAPGQKHVRIIQINRL